MSEALRALLIEDSESDAALVERALSRTGRELACKRVESADELRAALSAQRWDVVISDYQLPGFSAPQALAIVQETGLDLPFIVVSGTIGEDNAVAMMRAGAQDYLMKSNLARLPPAVVRELADARNRQARRDAEAAQASLSQQLVESQREAYVQLRAWHRRLELSKDEERRLLSRELHDELGQTLTALKLRLKVLSQVDAASGVRVQAALTLVDGLIDRVRKIALDLRPPLLDELGLESALRAFLDSRAQLAGTSWSLETEGLSARLAPEVEMACYRIVQEAVTNVLRHARARTGKVRVAHAQEQLSIAIVDDGCGFSQEHALARAKAGHLGLVGMRERAHALGGELIASSPPSSGEPFGTRIDVRLPAPPFTPG
jgi:signal transduction histidine kinase